MRLVVDASVALKWVLPERESPWALDLLSGGDELILPDFWLAEGTNVLWLQVRRKILTAREAHACLGYFRALTILEPTMDLGLHEMALEIGIAVNHSTYDTLYVAFAVAVGADHVIAADAPFTRNMRAHSNPTLSKIMLPLDEWAASKGL